MVQEGCIGNSEAHIHSFVHLESLERSIERRMEALVEGSLGASFMEGTRRLSVSFFCGVISCLVEGALLEEGTNLVGTSVT
jgi:hypothetical protein